MKITMSAGKGNEHVLEHDLNFAEERYESNHKVVCLVLLILLHAQWHWHEHDKLDGGAGIEGSEFYANTVIVMIGFQEPKTRPPRVTA